MQLFLQLPALKLLSMSEDNFCSPTSGSTPSSAPCTQLWAGAAGLFFNFTPRTRCRLGWKRRSIFEEYTFRWKWSLQLAWKLVSLEALWLIIPTPQRFSRNYNANVIFFNVFLRPRNFSSSWWLEEPSHFQLLLERKQEQLALEPGLIGALC